MPIAINNTPTAVADGTKPVLVSIEGEANQTTKYFYYGFGATEPTEFHVYNSIVNQTLLIGTEFGKLWVKSDASNININLSLGL